MNIVTTQLKHALASLISDTGIEFSQPPKPEMGDYALACFPFAKVSGKNPAEYASELAARINEQEHSLIQEAKAFGPYVNFFLNSQEVANIMLQEITSQKQYGSHDVGNGKTYVVEYACPNPFKAFHLGHLKNLITGEAVARMFENAGYKVIRVNYQGDVGMHVAKALWGIYDLFDEFVYIDNFHLKERVNFLGKAYAHGAEYFETGEKEREEVIEYNNLIYSLYKKIYNKFPNYETLDNKENIFFKECDFTDQEIKKFNVYRLAKKWSLEYFDDIYTRMGTSFDELFFESQTAQPGIELVKEFLAKGVFEEGDGGAIIFPGETYGLHNRVFINGKGFPTYEAKDLALAQIHFNTYNPDKIIHVVGKEQTDYFKVVITAIEQVFPNKKGIEYHLPGGFLQLKGDQKMSSRKGNIITGDQLIDTVRDKLYNLMEDRSDNFHERLEKITAAALKYAMLKADVSRDVAFDMEESISTSGDSGPYLLYILARINSIVEKSETEITGLSSKNMDISIAKEEKEVLFLLAEYPAITKKAVDNYDPSYIAKYLFSLAQAFNSFYAACPVLQADEQEKQFRLQLLQSVEQVMTHGLQLLGIEKVDRM